MKKFFILILLFVNICLSANAKNIQFIQVTDVHLTQQNAKYVKQFVDDVNKNFKDIDFIIFTGDNIDRANEQDLSLFLSIIKDLKFKTYITLGNHDLMKADNMTSVNYIKAVSHTLGHYHPSKPNYTFKKGDIVFIVMNGVKEVIPGPCGYFQSKELQWLDKQLSKYKNKKVVILQHFPLLDTNSIHHNLYKKENYIEILNKHNNVISIISGHYHQNREEKVNNVYHVITNNFSNNTFYKVITIDDKDGFVYTTLIDNSNNLQD